MKEQYNYDWQLDTRDSEFRDIMENIEIIEARKDEYEEIIDFMNVNFVPHEPLNIAINLCEAGYRKGLF